MWLQTVWFLARTDHAASVVLDEPDVYMHPDLQRRVLELVRDRFDQLLIATHSIEIVSDVAPRSILSIDRRQPRSTFVTDLPGVQEVINSLGSVHNVQVTRLFTSRSFLLVEGDDVKLLRILQQTLSPTAPPIDLVAHGELGGRAGWSSGIPGRLPKKNVQGEPIVRYTLLDRDYFPDEEVSDRYREAKEWRVNLRVWSRKELENFLVVPVAIGRFIAANVRRGVIGPDADRVTKEIDRIVESMKDVPIMDGFATAFLARDKAGGLPEGEPEGPRPCSRSLEDARRSMVACSGKGGHFTALGLVEGRIRRFVWRGAAGARVGAGGDRFRTRRSPSGGADW